MRSLYQYLQSHPKTAMLSAGFVLAGLISIGSEISIIYRQIAQVNDTSDDSTSVPRASLGVHPVSEVATDPKLQELMTRHHLGRKAANYVAHSEMKVLGQTDNSVQFAVTFPDKAVIVESFTVAADADYRATAAELGKTAQTGSQVRGVKFAFRKTGPSQWTYVLRYHMPYSALPPELLRTLQPSSDRRTSNHHFFDLVPSAFAQAESGAGTSEGPGDENGGNAGVAPGEAVIAVIANYFAEAYKGVDTKNIKSFEELLTGEGLEGVDNWVSRGADAPLALVDLADDAMTLKGWLSQIKGLQDCAKNPTNPLSQKAMHDSNYQHDVLDPLSDAESDILSTIAPTLASDGAGVASHWMPFGTGAVVAVVFGTLDDAVGEYAKGRIDEAGKYVVPCKPFLMTAADLRPMHGTVEYAYTRHTDSGSDRKDETRNGKGEFEMPVMNGGLYGEAPGELNVEIKSTTSAYPCPGGQYHLKAGEKAHITATGGTSMYGGSVELHLNGDLNVHEEGPVPDGLHCVDQSKDSVQYYGTTCRFNDIDFVHGGRYSTFASGEDNFGTCMIELSRK